MIAGEPAIDVLAQQEPVPTVLDVLTLTPPRLDAGIVTIRKALYKFYSAAQRVLAPGLRNSQYAYKEQLLAAINPETRWLDLGCGHQVLPDWMPGLAQEQSNIVRGCRIAVGIDADHLSLEKNALLRNKLRGDIHRLPFPNATFDLVTANVVVEHVRDPHALLKEVGRVLRPGGRFLFHTPNFWGYATLAACLMPRPLRLKLVYLLQARKEEDVFPTFYRLNTATAVHRLAVESSFDVIELRLVESSAQTVMLGPVVLLELLWIALLRLPSFENLRTNIIAVMGKPLRS